MIRRLLFLFEDRQFVIDDGNVDYVVAISFDGELAGVRTFAPALLLTPALQDGLPALQPLHGSVSEPDS